jgi:HAE1 family hydrophobic/amphiphilic exporter-1
MWIADVSIRRPVFAVMMIGSLVVLGLLGFTNLGVDLFPKVEFPYVSVTTRLEGASPETVETEITDILEGYVNNISGIERLRSSSSEGLSQITIEFKLEENADLKAQEVRDKVALARSELPQETEPSVVEKVDPDAAPILSVLVSGDTDIRSLSGFADDVVRERLQRIQGVGSINLVGDREREIRVWLDAQRMRAMAVTADDVVRAIEAEHAELPGGRMELASSLIELGVRTDAEAEDTTELADLVIRFNDNAPPTRLRDVALVEDGLEDERSYAILDGQRGVALEVRRQSGLNTVEVARRVRTAVGELRESAPQGVSITTTRDISRFIESSVADVTKELQIAMLLVVMITFFFLLSWRATLIVATAIPTSLIATFFVFDLAGIMVDDAIVVVEAIQKDVNEGKPAAQAASEATRRVSLAVLAGTFATLAVFVPIAFMEGVVGQFFRDYGLAIVFSVSVSLLVALTLSPMLCSRYLTAHDPDSSGHVLSTLERFHDWMAEAYAAVVRAAMRWRYLVILLAIGSVYLGALIAAQVPGGFTSKADRSEFQGQVELPPGTAIEESKSRAHELNRALSAVTHVQSVFVTVGAGAAGEPSRMYQMPAQSTLRKFLGFPGADSPRPISSSCCRVRI